MSSTFDAQPGECAETSGFLFSHKCGEMAPNVCSQCQKYVCTRHTVMDEQRMLCTTCGKGLATSSTSRYRDDPYFYSGVYYPSYHHYYYGSSRRGQDFTDGDEQALGAREADSNDVRAFEDNMGAS